MENQTPLLPPDSSLAELQSTLDEVIEQWIGGFGWAQFLQAILLSVPLIFDSQQTFISIYTDAEPTWHCTNLTLCNSSSSICHLPISAWAWDSLSYTTIISQWGLQCASSIITGLPSSSYLLGCLIGGFLLATAGDSVIGRKRLLFFSCLTMSLAAFATSFSTNIWVYSTLRFVSGFGRSSIMTTALVLLVEMVGKKWRGQVGIIAFLCYTIGLLSLPAIAYANKYLSWRNLYLWTSIPGVLYSTIAYFFVIESPRWLFIQGREAEAFFALRTLSSTNDHGLRTDHLPLNIMPLAQEELTGNFFWSLKHLFARRWSVKRILAAMAVGFGIGLVYYGMLLGVGNLGLNIYLSSTFNALLELPSYFVTFILIGKCKRRASILGFTMLSGAFSLGCAIAGDGHENVQFGLELASFFSGTVAFNVLLIYSTELFPTCVRNLAASMVRQAIVFGAVFSPLLIAAGRAHEFMSYGVFGLVIMCSGLFVIVLPETRGVKLCDTMDEQEEEDNTSTLHNVS